MKPDPQHSPPCVVQSLRSILPHKPVCVGVWFTGALATQRHPSSSSENIVQIQIKSLLQLAHAKGKYAKLKLLKQMLKRS